MSKDIAHSNNGNLGGATPGSTGPAPTANFSWNTNNSVQLGKPGSYSYQPKRGPSPSNTPSGRRGSYSAPYSYPYPNAKHSSYSGAELSADIIPSSSAPPSSQGVPTPTAPGGAQLGSQFRYPSNGRPTTSNYPYTSSSSVYTYAPSSSNQYAMTTNRGRKSPSNKSKKKPSKGVPSLTVSSPYPPMATPELSRQAQWNPGIAPSPNGPGTPTRRKSSASPVSSSKKSKSKGKKSKLVSKIKTPGKTKKERHMMRIDLLEKKSQLHSALGPALFADYWMILQGYIFGRLSKAELDYYVEKIFDRSKLWMHNYFILSLIHNAHLPSSLPAGQLKGDKSLLKKKDQAKKKKKKQKESSSRGNTPSPKRLLPTPIHSGMVSPTSGKRRKDDSRHSGLFVHSSLKRQRSLPPDKLRETIPGCLPDVASKHQIMGHICTVTPFMNNLPKVHHADHTFRLHHHERINHPSSPSSTMPPTATPSQSSTGSDTKPVTVKTETSTGETAPSSPAPTPASKAETPLPWPINSYTENHLSRGRNVFKYVFPEEVKAKSHHPLSLGMMLQARAIPERITAAMPVNPTPPVIKKEPGANPLQTQKLQQAYASHQQRFRYMIASEARWGVTSKRSEFNESRDDLKHLIEEAIPRMSEHVSTDLWENREMHLHERCLQIDHDSDEEDHADASINPQTQTLLSSENERDFVRKTLSICAAQNGLQAVSDQAVHLIQDATQQYLRNVVTRLVKHVRPQRALDDALITSRRGSHSVSAPVSLAQRFNPIANRNPLPTTSPAAPPVDVSTVKNDTTPVIPLGATPAGAQQPKAETLHPAQQSHTGSHAPCLPLPRAVSEYRGGVVTLDHLLHGVRHNPHIIGDNVQITLEKATTLKFQTM